MVLVGVAGWQGLRGDDARPSPAEPPSPTPSELSAEEEEFLAGDAPTPELLEGIWRLDNGVLLMSFTADGGIRYDERDGLFTSPAVAGSFEIAGDLITVEVAEGLAGGAADCGGQTFAMRASLAETGTLHVVHTRPGQGGCSRAQDQRWVMEQVLPANNEALAGWEFPEAPTWGRPPIVDALSGVWYSPGGEFVLEMLPQAHTVVDETGDVVDSGTWTTNQSLSRLTLVSSGESSTCRVGDRFVRGDLRYEHLGASPTTGALVGAVQRDDCGGGWAEETWIRLCPVTEAYGSGGSGSARRSDRHGARQSAASQPSMM